MLDGAFSPAAPLALVGAGKMGGAMLSGWLERGLDPAAVVVVDPAPPEDSAAMLSLAGIVPRETVPEGVLARVIVVAVKPQIMGKVLPGLRPLVGPATVALSIAAGTTLASLEAGLGPIPIVRSIPNTPAQIGRGITGAFANTLVDHAARALVTDLLEAVGAVAWLDRESDIDAVTAVSGSGPAYVFHLAECLAEAAVSLGLSPELADRLARATVEGAGELLYRSELAPAELRRNVTSPNGTTAAALAVLTGEGGLAPLMTRAVAAARKRSEELSA
ncbi:MAG TPA: pyrroline-5-carboxylate reductase [Bauldia sp.]|nr:pyrroline-5-carboxylate reductase [Bauldia sp.]